jgi:hypothetical protein
MTLHQLIEALTRAASLPAAHPVTGQAMTAGDLPVCLAVGAVPAEVSAIVADHWYVPAEPGGILYAGPHCLLTIQSR